MEPGQSNTNLANGLNTTKDTEPKLVIRDMVDAKTGKAVSAVFENTKAVEQQRYIDRTDVTQKPDSATSTEPDFNQALDDKLKAVDHILLLYRFHVIDAKRLIERLNQMVASDERDTDAKS